MNDELDGGLRRLVARLREPVSVDAEALARVKAAVRARAPRRRLARLARRLLPLLVSYAVVGAPREDAPVRPAVPAGSSECAGGAALATDSSSFTGVCGWDR